MMTERVITVSELIARHIGTVPGPDAGTCFLCGNETDQGHRRAPSSSFTAYADCSTGAVICPACMAALSHWDCRGRSWLVTMDRFRPVTKDDKLILRDALLDPPEPPYAIYVTHGRQKQSWITLARRVSTSRSIAIVGTDWTDGPVRVDVTFARKHDPLLRRLRERKLPKAALRANALSPATWSRAIQEGWDDDLWQTNELAGDPRWEVMIDAWE